MSLCGVGKDRHGKNMVVVWNTRFVASRNGEVSVVAKAHTDVDIVAMRIAEFDETRLAIFNGAESLECASKLIASKET